MKKNKHTNWTHEHPVEHPVAMWAILSVAFAIIIHVLFSIPAVNEFFVPKWSAGEILAYSSTVALGLLALHQNRVFKVENDKAQLRLEKLTAKANELTTINKIIEIESNNLFHLRKALDDFSSACDPIQITTCFANSQKNATPDQAMLLAMSAMANQEKIIDDSFFALARELRTNTKTIIKMGDAFDACMYNYYVAAKNVTCALRDKPRYECRTESDNLHKCKLDFISERERLLSHKEKMLNELIYGNLSLDEVKNMYHKEYIAKEQINDGQAKDAQPE